MARPFNPTLSDIKFEILLVAMLDKSRSDCSLSLIIYPLPIRPADPPALPMLAFEFKDDWYMSLREVFRDAFCEDWLKFVVDFDTFGLALKKEPIRLGTKLSKPP